jgi:hypothetical protein
MLATLRPIACLFLGAFLLVAPDASARKPKKHAARPRQPPIAFYLADGVKGATADQAIDKCIGARVAYQRKNPGVHGDGPERCAANVMAVHGPYVRKKGKGGYDDPNVHVYKGKDGVWLDEDGETACFAAGTRVATPEGDRDIEAMRPGDALYTWDPSSGRVAVGRVDRVKRRVDRPVGTLRFDDGTAIEATANHPFYSVAMAAFVEAGKLAPGDRVLRLDRGALREARLVAVTPFERVTDVFDLSVSPHHDFFAAGVLVHNY